MNSLHEICKDRVFKSSVTRILTYGLGARLIALAYSIIHDNYVSHIKYTDIDYTVFTNGAESILNGTSPYQDVEFRYSPLIGLIFIPNIFIERNVGKFMLVIADILCGYLIYRLNISQGANRQNSRLYLFYWLANPVTIAISSRGSFEPILTLVILLSVHMLTEANLVSAGFLYGLAIHLKLYPIIYSLPFYGYMLQKKPYIRGQSRLLYWVKVLGPGSSHWKFFLSALLSLISISYVCYNLYGHQYLEQSFIYHLKRKDFQHNFSIYFYLFHLFPKNIGYLNILAFVSQLLAILTLSICYIGYDTNRRVKLRKLNFSLGITTYIFVTLNKVCTSQYFNWYLVFVPLIMDSIRIDSKQAFGLAALWFIFQGNWLLCAYLYEYQRLDIINNVGLGSILFMITNLFILWTLCRKFDPCQKTSMSTE